MGIYNFRHQFVAYVEDGSKLHTIRAPRMRNGELAMDEPGDICHLYAGLRQKGPRLLRRSHCTKLETITIAEAGDVHVGPWINVIAVGPRIFKDPEHYGLALLSPDERDLLAWRDGFRPAGTSESSPAPAFDLFFRYWRMGQRSARGSEALLPFAGYIIHWSPANLMAKGR